MRAAAVSLLAVWWLGSVASVIARDPKEFAQGSDLTNSANYVPSGTPTATNDVRLSSAATGLSLDAANLAAGSLNKTNSLSYTISNNAAGTANSSLTLGGGDGVNTFGEHPADLIYISGGGSVTIQGPNGGDGIGVLNLSILQTVQTGRFNAAAGAGLTISAPISLSNGQSIMKTGAGSLNIAGTMGGFNAAFIVLEGTTNFTSEASSSGTFLTVSNPNTGAGSDVVMNLFSSLNFRGIRGSIAAPSKGQNTVTVNLIGTGTELALTFSAAQPNASFPGTIAGDGSVRLTSGGGSQTFVGANTYSGTTTVASGSLLIDGATAGQGDYVIGNFSSPSAALSGSGSVGLKPNSSVTVTSGRIDPGPPSAVGTLCVSASGTGGVVFGGGSMLLVQVAAEGVSDRLQIDGGAINLTATNDTLMLQSLAGAFDGTDYTIATFAQNVGGGVFNSVQGVPADYTVQYNPGSIRVVALQLPLTVTSAASRKTHGNAGSFDINLLVTEPVECRTSDGTHTLVFTFSNLISSGGAAVTRGSGTVAGAPVLQGKTMTVNLSGVADAQRLGVTLHDVTDRFGQALPPAEFIINILAGDTTSNRAVSASDVSHTKAQSGFATSATNFRNDVNVNGLVTASDISFVKARSGNFVPQSEADYRQ